MYTVTGASSCTSAYSNYRTRYVTRMTNTGGVSPVEITNGYFAPVGDVGYVQATFELLDPVTLNNTEADFFVYQDNFGTYGNGVVAFGSAPITLTDVNDVATAVVEVNLPYGVDPSHLHGVVILQEHNAGRAIIQTGFLSQVQDFALTIPIRMKSVPLGDGEAIFSGTLENIGTVADNIDLSIDAIFDGWSADFQIEGDATWYTSTSVALDPAEEVEVTIRVQTDGEVREGFGTFAASSNNSGRMQPMSLRVINGSYSVLMVDDDGGYAIDYPTEQPFIQALELNGFFYDFWDVNGDHGNATPTFGDMNGYDVVIWQTAWVVLPLNSDDKAAIMAYLDNGGNLFLSSMDCLVGSTLEPFFEDYFGVSTFAVNSQASEMIGTPGDPIGNGLHYTLDWPFASLNRADTINPGPYAATVAANELGESNVLRNEIPGLGRTVFSSIMQLAMENESPIPNDSSIFILKVINWLVDAPITADVETDAVPSATRLFHTRPNPAVSQARLSFSLSNEAAKGPVSLALMDVSGRRVRTLIDGLRPVGMNQVVWDGRDDHGRSVTPGIYFAKLQSMDGEVKTKLVLIK
ncbi:MAG: hypothetical protein KJ927_08510 [Candidatus Eisenbacteria bacterium]|nr:hypothetical protein [Candidatus Eisenbacteria bacterium]MBU1948738.1 hypothetical protein [Candidatus Eisenbacteria bacterium]